MLAKLSKFLFLLSSLLRGGVFGSCYQKTEEQSHEGTHCCLGGHAVRIVKTDGLASKMIAGTFVAK